MNKYVRGSIVIPCGTIKMFWTKLFHLNEFNGPIISQVSPFTEITLNKGGKLSIGSGFKMRDGAKIRVRKGAKCVIGKNTSINSNNMIACRESIIIGDNVQFSPNVQVYDHDHDFKDESGINAGKYRTTPIVIGDNVWIGANSIILRGAAIGNNTVIGAGSIVKTDVPAGTVFIQKRL